MTAKTRDRLLVFLLCLPLLVFLGYKVYRYATKYETVIVTEDAPSLAGVSIRMGEPSESDIGLPILPYTVVNDSTLQISEKTVRIETRQADGSWTYRRSTRPTEQPGGAIEISPGGSREMDPLNLKTIKPGAYRLAWDYYTAVEGDISYYTAYAEFTVD